VGQEPARAVQGTLVPLRLAPRAAREGPAREPRRGADWMGAAAGTDEAEMTRRRSRLLAVNASRARAVGRIPLGGVPTGQDVVVQPDLSGAAPIWRRGSADTALGGATP